MIQSIDLGGKSSRVVMEIDSDRHVELRLLVQFQLSYGYSLYNMDVK